MCILVPSVRRYMKMCKNCTMSTQAYPCVHCNWEPGQPTLDYRKNYNVDQKTNDKHNL